MGLMGFQLRICVLLVAALVQQSMAMDGMAATATGQCFTQGSVNSMGESCAVARAWFYKAPIFSLGNTPAAAVQAVATRAVSAKQLAVKNLKGVWSFFSMDSGVLGESVTTTTSGKALLLERQGSREYAVGLCFFQLMAYVLTAFLMHCLADTQLNA